MIKESELNARNQLKKYLFINGTQLCNLMIKYCYTNKIKQHLSTDLCKKSTKKLNAAYWL